MNIEDTLTEPTEEQIKIEEKPPTEPSKYDLLYEELKELDKDISDLVDLIIERDDGMKITQEIYDDYKKFIDKVDNIAALNIKKSKYEDTMDCYNALVDIYVELCEIEEAK